MILFSLIITWLLWLLAKPTREISVMSEYSQLLAAFALVGFCFVNFISTRHKILDYLFQGLDKSYIYHKYMSISALVLVIVHMRDALIKQFKNCNVNIGDFHYEHFQFK